MHTECDLVETELAACAGQSNEERKRALRIRPDYAAITEELQMLVRSGRFRDCWDLPPEEAFARLGVGLALGSDDWVHINWYGPLEIWRDPEHQVSDILYNGPPEEPFYVVQRGAMVCTGVTAHPDWITWTQHQLLLRDMKVLPYVLDWPPMAQGVADLLRYAITGPPVSRMGRSLSIRLLPERWRTLDDLVQAHIISREASELLLAGLASGASLLVAGPTGSGKTTLTAALTQAVGQRMRLVFVEDGGELPRSPNSLHLEAPAEEGGFTRAVTFALRQKPNYIIVGEVRGGEAMAMLQAAATGHPGVGTIHAGGVQGALRNLERMAMLGLAAEAGGGGQAAAQIVRGLITSDTVNLIVVTIGQTARGRRAVLSIEEVLRQGAQGQSGDVFPTNTLFSYDQYYERLVQTGNVNAAWGLGRF
ncbi:ATPase, T2SS/T4P/T4SS family [Candidatus Chloroploca asiatica]|uniref:ATPase, T2SS/T4P/T4SS family n=1 Tax=Candidatus Chloroploca asiatica TaxID=1506545 RepID=UPI000BE9AF94|nr:ATPase, T2SS/T4P/T4SS family [Candidatus Chloroploca asiatica]